MITVNRGFQPNSNMKRFEFTLFAPAISTSANLKLTAKFFLMNLSAFGSTHSNISMYNNKNSKLYALHMHADTITKSKINKFPLFLNFTENLVAHETVDCDVIERGGKQYVIVKNVRTNVNSIGYYSLKFESKMAPAFVTATVNRVINANWKLLSTEIKPQLESTVTDIIESFIIPFFNKIAIEDFYQSNLAAKQQVPK